AGRTCTGNCRTREGRAPNLERRRTERMRGEALRGMTPLPLAGTPLESWRQSGRSPRPRGAIMTPEQLPADWRTILADECTTPYFEKLLAFVNEQRAKEVVYPPEEDVFSAFRATPFDKVKVLLLGQDPYHGKGQAHGMCFSVRPGVRPPPSLVNMLQELHDDLGFEVPNHGNLEALAKRGVMLLN